LISGPKIKNGYYLGTRVHFSMSRDFLVKRWMNIIWCVCVLVIHSSNQCQQQAVSCIKVNLSDLRSKGEFQYLHHCGVLIM